MGSPKLTRGTCGGRRNAGETAAARARPLVGKHELNYGENMSIAGRRSGELEFTVGILPRRINMHEAQPDATPLTAKL